MRVPTVSPANDGYSCRELSLTEWWEKSPKGKEGGASNLEYSPFNSCRERITPLFRAFLYAVCDHSECALRFYCHLAPFVSHRNDVRKN